LSRTWVQNDRTGTHKLHAVLHQQREPQSSQGPTTPNFLHPYKIGTGGVSV
jgi:hypothetical protein